MLSENFQTRASGYVSATGGLLVKVILLTHSAANLQWSND